MDSNEPVPMNATKTEALDLLRHWQEQKRIVGWGFSVERAVRLTGYGLIVTLTDNEINIGSDDPACSFTLSLTDAEYAYTDLRELPLANRDSIESALVIRPLFRPGAKSILKLPVRLDFSIFLLTPEAHARMMEQ